MGDGILVRIELSNNGTTNVDGVRLSLADELVLMTADGHRMARSTSLTTGNVPNSATPAGQMFTRDAVLPLPATTGPTIAGAASKLIEHTYALKVDVSAGLRGSFSLTLPVVLWGGAAKLARVQLRKLPELPKSGGKVSVRKASVVRKSSDATVQASAPPAQKRAAEKADNNDDDGDDDDDDANKGNDAAADDKKKESPKKESKKEEDEKKDEIDEGDDEVEVEL